MISINNIQFYWTTSFISIENAHIMQLSMNILSLLLHTLSCTENNSWRKIKPYLGHRTISYAIVRCQHICSQKRSTHGPFWSFGSEYQQDEKTLLPTQGLEGVYMPSVSVLLFSRDKCNEYWILCCYFIVALQNAEI